MKRSEAPAAELLKARDETAFGQVFKSHFNKLHGYACTMIKDEADAEEAVQNVFMRLWEKPESLNLTGPLTAYLYRAVHNECLNYIKHQKVKVAHQLYAVSAGGHEYDSAAAGIGSKELQVRITDAMNSLPEQCRTIFQLSRFEDLKYREIADRMELSVKTVENQMGKALKIMRSKLSEFLAAIIIVLTAI